MPTPPRPPAIDQPVATPGTPTSVQVEFPCTPLRLARAPLHPSTLDPRAYFCYGCDRQYDRPPLDQLDAATGELIRRMCVTCRCEAIEVIESPTQSRSAADFAAGFRRRAGERLAQQQPVTIRIVEQLPNGTAVVRVVQTNVPWHPGTTPLERMGGLDDIMRPFIAATPIGFLSLGGAGLGGGGGSDGGLESLLGRLFSEAQASFDGRGEPASAEALARVRHFAPDADLPDLCTVCQDAPTAGAACARLPCGHVFHDECVKPWLDAHDTCPVCRSRLIASGSPAE